MRKRVLSLALAFILCLSLLPFGAMAADIVESGKCGENVTWTLDSNGKLTISGTGKMVVRRWSNEAVRDVVIEDGVTEINWRAFSNCVNLKTITMADSVTFIMNDSIDGCTSLESVKLSNQLSLIHNREFYGCTSLKSITIPDSVTSIWTSAFEGCTSLERITIPAGVTAIDEKVFSGCTGLKEINVAAANSSYVSVNGVLFNKDRTELIAYPAGKTDSSYVIPQGVTKIHEKAFQGASSLQSVTIPDSVTELGNYAFQDCTGLKQITIPKAISYVDSVFKDCTGLEAFNVSAENPDLISRDGVLFGSDGHTLYNYPAGRKAETYTIPADVSRIGEFAFNNCVYLKHVIIPDGMEEINAFAFSNCKSLKRVTIPDSVKVINGAAFSNTGLESVSISPNVSFVGASAFQECSSLQRIEVDPKNEDFSSVDGVLFNKDHTALLACPPGKTGVYTVPDGVVRIEDAFYSCTNLEQINLPNGVQQICREAFYGCTNLKQIHLPDGLEEIGEHAFANCSSLKEITIPSSVSYIDDYAFSGCSSLTKVTLSDETGFGIGEFGGCSSLTSIILPKKEPSITWAMFRGCTGLKSVTIPASVEYIGSDAFVDCTGMTELIIPETVQELHNSAFSDCSNLKSVTIPVSITKIPNGAFSGCYALRDVYYNGTSAQWAEMKIEDFNEELLYAAIHCNDPVPTPKPTATPAPTAQPTAKPTATPAPTAKPTATPAPTAKPTATPAPTAKPTATPAPTAKPTATPAPTAKPTATPAPTAKPTAAPAPTAKPTATPAPTAKPEVKNPFKDVSKDQYYYDPVLWAVNHDPQITAGTSATTFSPENPCTRGQMVTFLWRAKGCPEPKLTKNPFTDVKSSDYFYKAVLWAVENEITAGTSKTTFSPAATVTRAQTVTFLWRTEGKPAVQTKNPFTDVPAGQYYTDAVLWAVKNNITAGTSATTFSPSNPCTRGQIVTFLYRDMK